MNNLGFEVLQRLKDRMIDPILKKRRHLGCEECGKTFYGHYQNTGYNAVPNGKESPHPTKKGWIEVHTYDGIFYPDCPECIVSFSVRDAKTAKIIYEKETEKNRKKQERRKARQAYKDAQPVNIGKKLTYLNKEAYHDRIGHLAAAPDNMTKYEMMSSYFLDKVFWERFGKGCHTLEVRNFTIKKQLHDGTYMSNSGKTRMGRFMPYFEIKNKLTGKQREVGGKEIKQFLDLRESLGTGTNRRNDPDRAYGLPNSRGYR